MVTQAIAIVHQADGTGTIVVRGHSTYDTRSVISACLRSQTELPRHGQNTAVQRAIVSIPDDALTP